MDKLENRSSRIFIHHKLIQRIESVRIDPRYTFMFDNANVGGDTMADTLRQVTSPAAGGRHSRSTITQLAGFPAEVVDSVVSVLCRMAFDFGMWSDSAFPLLFVCEEAHRYASGHRAIGSAPPNRKALSRIAKEGREDLGVSGRHITSARRSSTPPSSRSARRCLRCAGRSGKRRHGDRAFRRVGRGGEPACVRAFARHARSACSAFGEGVALPDTAQDSTSFPRTSFAQSQAVINVTTDATRGASEDFIDTIIDRWRGATMSHKGALDTSGDFQFVGARRVLDTVGPAGPLDCAAAERSAAARRAAAARSGSLPPVEEADRGRQRVRCARRARCAAAVAAVRLIGGA